MLFDLRNPLFHHVIAQHLFGESPPQMQTECGMADESVSLRNVVALAPPVRLSEQRGANGVAVTGK